MTNLNRTGILQTIASCEALKEAIRPRLGALQEAETRAQNDLIAMRQLDGMLDFFIEMMYSDLERLTKEEPQ